MELKACSKCGVEQEWSQFQIQKGKPTGQCRSCKTETAKAKRLADGIPVKRLSFIENGHKLCMRCDQMKPLDEFSPTPRGLGGVAANCKPCTADAARERDKEPVRARTAKYRKDHRERHLAGHRVRMFEYRTRKKVTDDGTVTEEFLKALYATTHCHYCKQPTAEPQRTADHKTALAQGGAHSADNLCMACHSCNSAKRDLNEAQFLERLKA